MNAAAIRRIGSALSVSVLSTMVHNAKRREVAPVAQRAPDGRGRAWIMRILFSGVLNLFA